MSRDGHIGREPLERMHTDKATAHETEDLSPELNRASCLFASQKEQERAGGAG
jgi:hypothetical protein